MSELMQLALHTVETRTYKRKLPDFFEPLFFGVTLHCSMLVKHLGLVLDSQLTWREYVNMYINVKKANNRYVGLRPGWSTGSTSPSFDNPLTLHLQFAGPAIKQLVPSRLSRIQRIVCLVITAVMHNIPMGAMDEPLTCLQLDLVFKDEARFAN